jgi:hypothetical protein
MPGSEARAIRTWSWLLISTGIRYDIEASIDLKAWARMTTLTNETGTLSFTDPVAGAAQRFFRVGGK